jgi:hypothetical protein
MCYSYRVPERERKSREQAQKQSEDLDQEGEKATPSLIEGEDKEARLTKAVRLLLDALDRCSGDPLDCPHCGPSRTYALNLLNNEQPQQNDRVQSSTEQERVSLSGRVGADPTFRTTPKGTLVARFSLAVHLQENQTQWQQIVAFNQRAERLKESLKKGQSVQVIGYQHSREAPTRDGGTRTISEIYAVTITSPRAR